MKAEYERLISDVIAGEEFRPESLNGYLAAAGRERRRRHVRRIVAVALLPLVALAAILSLQQRPGASHEPVVQMPQPEFIAGTPIQVINDEQLLLLFKDRPVALVGPPGRQRLLLLDEEFSN
jgi:hypothetical protein